MEAVALLCDLIAQRQPVAASGYTRHQAFKHLAKAGLTEDYGVVQSVHCDDCNQPHDAAVVFENGSYGYYCPEVGFVALDRSEIAAVQPKTVSLVDTLAQTLNCKRRKSKPIHGDTWRIGTAQTHAGDVVVYFHPILQDANDLHSLESALALEVKGRFGIVLTALGSLKVDTYKTVSLADCLSFDPSGNQLCFEADIAAIAGVPELRTGGRPNSYRTNIQKIMTARDREGRSVTGRNAEAKGVLTEYAVLFPNQPIPSKSVVNRYVSEIRSGS